MTAPIGGVPIGGVAPVTSSPIGGAGDATRAGGARGPAGGTGVDFAAALDHVAQAQHQADALGVGIATGQAADIHQFMAAASKARLAMELTVAVRDRAVEAYQEVMRMQV